MKPVKSVAYEYTNFVRMASLGGRSSPRQILSSSPGERAAWSGYVYLLIAQRLTAETVDECAPTAYKSSCTFQLTCLYGAISAKITD